MSWLLPWAKKEVPVPVIQSMPFNLVTVELTTGFTECRAFIEDNFQFELLCGTIRNVGGGGGFWIQGNEDTTNPKYIHVYYQPAADTYNGVEWSGRIFLKRGMGINLSGGATATIQCARVPIKQ